MTTTTRSSPLSQAGACALALSPLAAIISYTLLAPYTKVEESFTLHALRDVLLYGFSREKVRNAYDHVQFPGAVPRSFVPAILLAALESVALRLVRPLGLLHSERDVQVLARCLLGTANAAAMEHLRRTVKLRSTTAANLFVVMNLVQFHWLFYASRTLPNFTAMPFVVYACSLIFREAIENGKPINNRPLIRPTFIGIALLSWTAAVIRAEVALMLLALVAVLSMRMRNRSFLRSAFLAILTGGGFGLGLSLYVDSYFWGKWIWPEAYGILFNVLQGNSAEWGVSPAHAYATSLLPKITLFPLLLAIYALLRPSTRQMLGEWTWLIAVPCITLVGGMSALGHKEWRFIAYVVPLINVAAAFGGADIARARRQKGLLGKAVLLFLVGGLFLSALVTSAIALASIYNYPGGEAMAFLHRHLSDVGSPVKIALHSAPLQSGASQFTFEHQYPSVLQNSRGLPRHWQAWEYNRSEDLLESAPEVLSQELIRLGFDYAVVPFVERFEEDGWVLLKDFRTLGVARGRKSLRPEMQWRRQFGIMQRPPRPGVNQ